MSEGPVALCGVCWRHLRILIKNGHIYCFWMMIFVWNRKVFIEQHLDYEPAMEVATADLVIPLLQNNLGVGFVPEPLAAPFFENGNLVPLTLNVPLPSREI